MSEFRSGNKGRSHPYPATPRAAAAAGAGPFARNSASGPAADQEIAIAPGTLVSWSTLESGVAGTNVPITPIQTGIIHVTGDIYIASLDAAGEVAIGFVLLLDGNPVTVPLNGGVTLPAGDADRTHISIDTIVGAGANTPALTTGVVANFSVRITAGSATDAEILASSATLHLEEVRTATG